MPATRPYLSMYELLGGVSPSTPLLSTPSWMPMDPARDGAGAASHAATRRTANDRRATGDPVPMGRQATTTRPALPRGVRGRHPLEPLELDERGVGHLADRPPGPVGDRET